jgi:hypothetical protein
MAKLTKAEAARQMGISRTTLYKFIHEGKVSVHPDGTVDTAELVRAVSTLSPTVHRGRPERVHAEHRNVHAEQIEMDISGQGYEHRSQFQPVHTEHTGQVSTGRQLTGIVDTLQQTVDILRQELLAAREREQDYREQLVWLRQHIEQLEHRYDRLLEAPRVAPTWRALGPPQATPAGPLPEAWQAILTHLQQTGPQRPEDVRKALGWSADKKPRYTMRRMVQAGILVRARHGVYALPEQAG